MGEYEHDLLETMMRVYHALQTAKDDLQECNYQQNSESDVHEHLILSLQAAIPVKIDEAGE